MNMEEEENKEGQLEAESKATALGEAASPDRAAGNATTDDGASTAGTGRSYECTFCKRGFSTAQALGGHMNIHRRDRPRVLKSSPAASASSKRPEDGSSEARYGYYHPYSIHKRSSSAGSLISSSSGHSLQEHEHMHASRHMRSTSSSIEDDDPRRRRRELSLFGEDVKRDDAGEEKGSGEEVEELDLELRLGHDK